MTVLSPLLRGRLAAPAAFAVTLCAAMAGHGQTMNCSDSVTLCTPPSTSSSVTLSSCSALNAHTFVANQWATAHFRRIRGYRDLPTLTAALAILVKESAKAA